MAALLDRCIFTPSAGGTGDFVVSAAVSGYQTPAQAGGVNGKTYHYAAESSDKSQWEVGAGIYTVASTTLARTTILFSSTGGGKINFSGVPTVMISALAEDFFEVVTQPINEGDTGTAYQIAFDGSGNLYFCYGTNAWAKYTNVAPFGNHFRGTQAGDARITQDGSPRLVTG